MQYDLLARLNKVNEKHTIRLDEEHEYKVNSSAPAALKIQAIVKAKPKNDEDDGEKSINDLYSIIGVGLGKEASDYVKKEEYSTEALALIVKAITAAIGNESLEKFEEEEKETPSDK